MLCAKNFPPTTILMRFSNNLVIGDQSFTFRRRRNKKLLMIYFIVWLLRKLHILGLMKVRAIADGDKLDPDNFKLICEAHRYVTNKFYILTKLNKRSLAAKYLHFHKPIVPIYDSRASKSIIELFKTNQFLKEFSEKANHGLPQKINADEEYFKFIRKIFGFQEFLVENNCRYYSARDIDKYLVDLQERKEKNKV